MAPPSGLGASASASASASSPVSAPASSCYRSPRPRRQVRRHWQQLWYSSIRCGASSPGSSGRRRNEPSSSQQAGSRLEQLQSELSRQIEERNRLLNELSKVSVFDLSNSSTASSEQNGVGRSMPMPPPPASTPAASRATTTRYPPRSPSMSGGGGGGQHVSMADAYRNGTTRLTNGSGATSSTITNRQPPLEGVKWNPPLNANNNVKKSEQHAVQEEESLETQWKQAMQRTEMYAAAPDTIAPSPRKFEQEVERFSFYSSNEEQDDEQLVVQDGYGATVEEEEQVVEVEEEEEEEEVEEYQGATLGMEEEYEEYAEYEEYEEQGAQAWAQDASEDESSNYYSGSQDFSGVSYGNVSTLSASPFSYTSSPQPSAQVQPVEMFRERTTPIISPPPPSPPPPSPLAAPTVPKIAAKTSTVAVAKTAGEFLEQLEAGEEGLDTLEDGEQRVPPERLNIVLVGAECAPWSKTGGLGDVVGSLPKAFAKLGHRVMCIAPRYANYAEGWDTGVRIQFNVKGQTFEVGYFHGYIDDVDYIFVDHPIFHGYEANIYGGSREDLLVRLQMFCRAAIEAPLQVPCGGCTYGDENLIYLANDWHTSLLPVYLQAYYRDHSKLTYSRAALVLHNIAHQGRAPLAEYELLDLPEHFKEDFRLYDPIGGEHMNILMAGIKYATRVIAVSGGYCWETKTQEGGWGLDSILRESEWKYCGIVNGIGGDWDPETDAFLEEEKGYMNYTVENFIEGKATNKAALQKELGLPQRPDVPLIGFIGRLDYQKGVDLIQEVMPWLMGNDVQFIMLGTGRQELEEFLRASESSHKDKVRGWVGFSVPIAHKITAAADLLLMPSRFEPCGLNQLYAMRYGTLPIVHAVGGLRDTVPAFNPFENSGFGWAFDRASADGLMHATGNALDTYFNYGETFNNIQKRAMEQDLSWNNAALQYEGVLIDAKYQW